MGNEVSVNEVVPARAYQVAGNRKMGNEVSGQPKGATRLCRRALTRLPATERWATRLCRRRIVLTGNLVSVNLVSGNRKMGNEVSGAAFGNEVSVNEVVPARAYEVAHRRRFRQRGKRQPKDGQPATS